MDNGALVSFTVNGDSTAEGRIVGNVAFMFLRDQRIYASIDDEECDETTARASHTSVAPYSVAGDYDAALAIGMKVPGCSVITVPYHRGSTHGPTGVPPGAQASPSYRRDVRLPSDVAQSA